jgi:hypothetical protein
VRRVATVVVIVAALAGCGGKDTPSDTEQVRSALVEFGKATAAKDYKTMCTKLLAQSLLDKMQAVGIGCEEALQKGLGDVKSPKLSVGKITVDGPTARAEVRTSAEGQEPSDDTIELRKVNGSWRISSLAGGATTGPAP